MKERGMIFNGDMVQALWMVGRRRRAAPSNGGRLDAMIAEREGGSKMALGEDARRTYAITGIVPFGAVGDRIWVRETWAILGNEMAAVSTGKKNFAKQTNAQRGFTALAASRTR
jgi:hypothetical protein